MEAVNLCNDIYFKDDYISLYLNNGNDAFCFEYTENSKKFISKSIKKPITKIGDVIIEDGFYDLETAYGYGGYCVNNDDKKFLNKALKEYEEACQREKIISEFIRFHPFNSFPVRNSKYLDFNMADRKIVVFDLKKNILSSYKSKLRSVIKKSLSSVEIRESSNIDKFVELYELTMKKNKANEFYYFERALYEKLIALEQVRLYEARYENKVIAMAFFMFGDDFVHYHLSANSSESYRYNANYALIHSLFGIAKQENKDYFILGGGSTSESNDPLLKFKEKFSKETRNFYIAGKIYNRRIYQKYCSLWEEQADCNQKYFLKYRLAI
ncbi:hypothetical protein MNBD_GAMMA11-1563 [hydrothermal vent metagenome]|uniref:BioF2-like acetyltransferase domain-containing protein n=1 Tax=hydrothermal vent metagenome TaxID=652676 RepID=A0A3B0Y491_9ZZZZ